MAPYQGVCSLLGCDLKALAVETKFVDLIASETFGCGRTESILIFSAGYLRKEIASWIGFK
jgi:hypothetical protein